MKDGDGMGSGSQRSRACARDPLIIDTPAGTNASNPYQVHVCMVQVNMSVASAALVDLPSRPRQQAPGWESQQPVGTKTPKLNVGSYSSIVRKYGAHILALCTIDFSHKTVSSFIQQHWQRKHSLAKIHCLVAKILSHIPDRSYKWSGVTSPAWQQSAGRMAGTWPDTA